MGISRAWRAAPGGRDVRTVILHISAKVALRPHLVGLLWCLPNQAYSVARNDTTQGLKMARPINRTRSVRIRLSVSMFERLDGLANAVGMPVATLGAMAVGQYVARQERTIEQAGRGSHIGEVASKLEVDTERPQAVQRKLFEGRGRAKPKVGK